MKIAVTGATGFVGRHVLRELSTRPGLAVVAAARADKPAVTLPGAPLYVTLDLASTPLDPYAWLGQPDVLIHLAWTGLPNYRSLHHFESELPRQYAFLQSMVRGGLPSLFVTGTCYEYGMTDGELTESLVARPGNPYGYAKNALREQLQFLRSTQAFGLTWARLFYMHGEGQSSTSLLPQLAAAVARGDRSFGMSGGEQLRDYLAVEQVARYIVDLALRCPDAGIVNVCSGKPTSVRALVERFLVQNHWDIALDLGRYPYPDYEPLAFWGSSSKLAALLSDADSASAS